MLYYLYFTRKPSHWINTHPHTLTPRNSTARGFLTPNHSQNASAVSCFEWILSLAAKQQVKKQAFRGAPSPCSSSREGGGSQAWPRAALPTSSESDAPGRSAGAPQCSGPRTGRSPAACWGACWPGCWTSCSAAEPGACDPRGRSPSPPGSWWGRGCSTCVHMECPEGPEELAGRCGRWGRRPRLPCRCRSGFPRGSGLGHTPHTGVQGWDPGPQLGLAGSWSMGVGGAVR